MVYDSIVDDSIVVNGTLGMVRDILASCGESDQFVVNGVSPRLQDGILEGLFMYDDSVKHVLVHV